MTSKPHIAFGLFNGAVLLSYFQITDHTFTSDVVRMSIAGTATLIGSLAPDIDSSGSIFSKTLPFIAKPIQKRWPHRTLCHSLIGALICSTTLYYITDFLTNFIPIPAQIPFIIWAFFLNAYVGHLIVDSLTITGIKWLFPYNRAFAYPSSRQHRVRTGDRKSEKYYTLFFLLLSLSYLPVLKAGGASRSIHKTFRNFQMAKDDYLKAINIETYLKFKGSYRHNRQAVSQNSIILDVKDQHFIVYAKNKILTVGEQALILGTEFVCDYTDTTPKILERTITYQTLDSILVHIPENALIQGKLSSTKTFQTTTPIYTANDFQTTKTSTNTLTFTYANKSEAMSLNVRIPEDVRRLQNNVRTLKSELEDIERKIQNTTQNRSTQTDLVVRYHLQEEIKTLKKQKTAQEKTLKTKQQRLDDYGSPEITFTGKLVIRTLPSDVTHSRKVRE